MKVDLPFPHPALWPNGRAHWRAVATQKKLHRKWAEIATYEAMQDYLATSSHFQDREIAITIHVYAKGRGKLPDRDNCVAASKAFLDGIADALAVDDRHFLTPKVEFANEREGRFVVEVA